MMLIIIMMLMMIKIHCLQLHHSANACSSPLRKAKFDLLNDYFLPPQGNRTRKLTCIRKMACEHKLMDQSFIKLKNESTVFYISYLGDKVKAQQLPLSGFMPHHMVSNFICRPTVYNTGRIALHRAACSTRD